MTSAAPGSPRRIVVLARSNDATAMLVHYLAGRFDDIVTVIEEPGSRAAVLRRRARRLGWIRVGGQVAFTTLVLPFLQRRGATRVAAIVADADLDASSLADVYHVESVNSPECIALLRVLTPAVVVVQGTRIISSEMLEAVDSPFVNTHAGITPRYRGMHGGYWALTEGRPDLVGTTVHLVDTGIDTGVVLARAYFTPGPEDSIATYPYLHLVAGLPALAEQLQRLLGGTLTPPSSGTRESSSSEARFEAESPAAAPPGDSRLWWHPTLWGYLARRWSAGVR